MTVVSDNAGRTAQVLTGPPGGQAAGDYVSLKAWCPATPVVPNAAGTGNCNLVDPGVGVAILIVPAPPGTGAFDVDLALANPIPADTDDDGVGEGFYSWSAPDVGRGEVSAGAPGASLFNLFAIDIDFARFVNKLPLLGSGVYDMTVPAIKPKKIMPQWKQRVTLHNAGHTGLSLVWYMTTARVKTL